MDSLSTTNSLPQAFVWRRLHSLMGLWLVLFLIEHLLVNSQAALLLGESGRGFVEMVNGIHNLPYLQAIEITLLGVPIFIHLVWGVKYLFTAKYNSFPNDGRAPHLKYGRNHAYTWQRITSWILLILLLFHIVKFRFLDYPDSVNVGSRPTYFVHVRMDPGLYFVADRLHAVLYDQNEIASLKNQIMNDENRLPYSLEGPSEPYFDIHTDEKVRLKQQIQEKKRLVNALEKKPLQSTEVIAAADNFGTASLLIVRDTFKSPFYVAIYTIFVAAACFHGFNGFWTFLLTWGWILNVSSQKKMLRVAIGLMILIGFLGLAAVWGTYYLNLKT